MASQTPISTSIETSIEACEEELSAAQDALTEAETSLNHARSVLEIATRGVGVDHHANGGRIEMLQQREHRAVFEVEVARERVRLAFANLVHERRAAAERRVEPWLQRCRPLVSQLKECLAAAELVNDKLAELWAEAEAAGIDLPVAKFLWLNPENLAHWREQIRTNRLGD